MLRIVFAQLVLRFVFIDLGRQLTEFHARKYFRPPELLVESVEDLVISPKFHPFTKHLRF